MTRAGVRFDIEKAKRMLAEGVSWYRIARELGVNEETVKRALKPGFAEMMAARKRERYIAEGGGPILHVDFMTAEAKRDGLAKLAEIPPDTRDLTARLCGDPLPGRRAIDRIAK